MGIKFASEEWMVALKDELNKSEGYRDAAKTWEGDFYWVITGMPGEPGDVYLYVDLWHGECRDAYRVATPRPRRPSLSSKRRIRSGAKWWTRNSIRFRAWSRAS